MDFKEIFKGISAGIMVTDADFKVTWANKFEEDYYGMELNELLGLWVVDCHKQENKEKIEQFLQRFKSQEIKEFTKIAAGMVITYSSYYNHAKFAGIVRTRIRIPSE